MLITILLVLLFVPNLSFSREKVTLFTQRVELSNKPLISCEALANYLNLKSSKYLFACSYIPPEEFISSEELSFKIAIISGVLFTHLKEKANKLNTGLYPLFTIFSTKFSHNGQVGALFFTRSNSSINSLKDIKNKKLALVSECASCSILALYELKKHGIDEKDLKIYYMGSWEKVIEAVLKGNADVGSVRIGILENLSREGKLNLHSLKFIELKRYPNFPFLVSSELIPDYYLVYSLNASPELIAELYRLLAPFASRHYQTLPNSDLSLILPYDPYKIIQMQRNLMIGPFAYLKREIEREKRKALYFYLLLSCISVAITLYVFYLYRIQKKYRIELEEATHILEDALQERSTSLRLISQKLREEIHKLEKILTTIDWGIALIDSKGTIIKVNNAFNKIFHVRELDVLGKPITKIFENFISSESQNISNNLKLSYTKFTTKINLKDQEKFLLIAKTPIEETPYSLITIRDITLEKKWEEEITRYTQLETLRVIASGLAHDLNNLLATILNNVEILLILFGSQVPLQAKEKIEQIKKTCLRAKSLTQQLLIYGKSLILSVEEYSLISWLKEIVDLTLAGSRIEVQYIMDPDIKSIIGDKNLLGIALQNILLNSRQAMQDKGTIKIYVEKKLPFIVIAIHDSGPGIPEEIKDKLFQPFTSTKPGGSGLGLFSTKRIVEAHDGKIEVESTPGMGTLVKIYLPFREAVEKEREEKEKETFPAFHGKKVLLMDDEEDLRETLKELLEISGYVVTACERGEEAIELYQREGPFDVVILDLTVPGKYDGIQTFLELKKIDPEIKAILATGYAYKNEVVDAKSLGFFEVLLKPFSFENLIEVLEKISR